MHVTECRAIIILQSSKFTLHAHAQLLGLPEHVYPLTWPGSVAVWSE